MNLRRIDLNLLVVFDALITERHVTRAADRIGMSQPAVSNALSRLRHQLKDELFVRTATTMQPTPRALELAGEIRQALYTIESALAPQAFDPLAAIDTFTIETSDYMVSTCMPPFMQALAAQGPGINVRIMPQGSRTLEHLDTREVDLAVGVFAEPPPRFGVTTVEDNIFAVIMRRKHPLARGKFTLARFAKCLHLLVTSRGDPSGFVDIALEDQGLSRRIALTINQFSMAAPIVAETDLIATLPKRIAEQYADRFNLTIRPTPIPPPPEFQSVDVIWHTRFGQHPAHVWFRELLTAVIRENSDAQSRRGKTRKPSRTKN